MNRRNAIFPLIPVAPACVSTRMQWVEFVVSAAEAQTHGKHGGPLDLRRGTPAFNFSWDFCRDCPAKYALAMQSLKRCNPTHLKDMRPVSPTKTPKEPA